MFARLSEARTSLKSKKRRFGRGAFAARPAHNTSGKMRKIEITVLRVTAALVETRLSFSRV